MTTTNTKEVLLAMVLILILMAFGFLAGALVTVYNWEYIWGVK